MQDQTYIVAGNNYQVGSGCIAQVRDGRSRIIADVKRLTRSGTCSSILKSVAGDIEPYTPVPCQVYWRHGAAPELARAAKAIVVTRNHILHDDVVAIRAWTRRGECIRQLCMAPVV